VLLQVAHPLVAVGVVEHCGYDRDLWRRLVRTLRALYLIVFGDWAEAEHAGAAVQAVHGQTSEQLGPFPPRNRVRRLRPGADAVGARHPGAQLARRLRAVRPAALTARARAA
jgi:ER-bound oxygenase mpaB/B'/Rubber oxygenase, catalytic domain